MSRFQYKFVIAHLVLIVLAKIMLLSMSVHAAESNQSDDNKPLKTDSNNKTNTQNIYRNINEDGVVEFSDQSIPNAKAIQIKSINTFKPAPKKPAVIKQQSSSLENPITKNYPYTKIRINSPSNNQAIRSNNGELAVSIAVSPTLNIAQGDQIELFLDGKSQGKQPSTHYQLKNIDRGQHQVRVNVINKSGAILKKSQTVQFNILRQSVLFKQRPKP